MVGFGLLPTSRALACNPPLEVEPVWLPGLVLVQDRIVITPLACPYTPFEQVPEA